MKEGRYALIILLFCGLLGCESDIQRRERLLIEANELLNTNRLEQSLQLYDAIIKEFPDFSKAYNNRGVAKSRLGRPAEAVQDYNVAIAIDPEYWESIQNRAQAYEESGRYDKSLDDYDLLIEAFPDSIIGYFGKGLVFTQMRKYKSAIEAFDRVMEVDPNNIDALINKGTLWYYLENPELSEKILNEVIEQGDHHGEAYNTLNQIYNDRGDYLQALSFINLALEIHPMDPYFLNNRGFTYLNMDSLDLAIEDINRSIVLDPENLWAYRNKGIYFLRVGDYDQAVRYMEETTNSFVENAHFYLGEAYWAAGNTARACEEWRKGKEKGESRSQIRATQACSS